MFLNVDFDPKLMATPGVSKKNFWRKFVGSAATPSRITAQ